jgi:hypothetical protein
MKKLWTPIDSGVFDEADFTDADQRAPLFFLPGHMKAKTYLDRLSN